MPWRSSTLICCWKQREPICGLKQQPASDWGRCDMAKHPLRVLVTGVELVSSAVDKLASIGASMTMMSGKVSEQRLIEELAKQPVQAILMRGNPPVSEAVLNAAPELRVIAKHGAGVDSVDLAAATARKVLVMVAGDAN